MSENQSLVPITQKWANPSQYVQDSWKLGTPRGKYVRDHRLKSVLKLFSKDDLILDIGTGVATLSRHFFGEVIGCDISLPMLLKAKIHLSSVVLCDAQYLPFREKIFNASFESGCLYLVPDKIKALSEQVRVTKRIVITFESNRWSLRRLITESKTTRQPTPLMLKKYYKKLELKFILKMVGFAPFTNSEILIKLWRPLEYLIERIPLINYLCGGILVYSMLIVKNKEGGI